MKTENEVSFYSFELDIVLINKLGFRMNFAGANNDGKVATKSASISNQGPVRSASATRRNSRDL